MQALNWTRVVLLGLLLVGPLLGQDVQVDHNPAFENVEDEMARIVEPPPTPEQEAPEFRGSSVLRGSIVGMSPSQKLTLLAPEPGSDSVRRMQWDLPISNDRTFGKMSMAEGRYFLRIEDEAGERPLEEYQLGFLGVLRFQLNMNNRVRVGGPVVINGRPVAADRLSLGLMPKGNVQVITRLLVAEGNVVQAFVPPGEYELVCFSEQFGMTRTGLMYRIAPEPTIQRLSLDIPAADVELRLELPSGVSESSGHLIFDFMTPLAVEEHRMPYTGQPVRVVDLFASPAVYFIGFESTRGLSASAILSNLDPGRVSVKTLRVLDQPSRDYELTVALPKGTWEYKLYVPPGSWFLDPLNPEAGGEGSVTNSMVRVPGGANAPDGSRSVYPVVNDETGEVTFRYRSPHSAAKPYVRGTFNDWAIDPRWRLRPTE